MRTVAIAKLKGDMGIDSVEGEREEYITGPGRFSQEIQCACIKEAWFGNCILAKLKRSDHGRTVEQ